MPTNVCLPTVSQLSLFGEYEQETLVASFLTLVHNSPLRDRHASHSSLRPLECHRSRSPLPGTFRHKGPPCFLPPQPWNGGLWRVRRPCRTFLRCSSRTSLLYDVELSDRKERGKTVCRRGGMRWQFWGLACETCSSLFSKNCMS